MTATLEETITALKAGQRYWEAPPVCDAKERLKEVARVVIKDKERLDMDHWIRDSDTGSTDLDLDPDADFTEIAHSCGTTACIAGWAILLAGNEGKELLEAVRAQDCEDPEEYAGGILLGDTAEGHFYDDEEEALEFLQDVLDRE